MFYYLLYHMIYYQLGKPGRVDSGDIPAVQNVTSIMDFTFDPFHNNRLVVGELFEECFLEGELVD